MAIESMVIAMSFGSQSSHQVDGNAAAWEICTVVIHSYVVRPCDTVTVTHVCLGAFPVWAVIFNEGSVLVIYKLY